MAETAGITFIQRFGSKLNLNPHLHMLLADGVFEVIDDQTVRFRKTPSPTDEDIVSLVGKIAKRISRALRRKGLVSDRATPSMQPRSSRPMTEKTRETHPLSRPPGPD